MNNDQVEGAFTDFGGKAEKAVGEAIGSDKLVAEGTLDSVKGKAQEAFGNVKHKAADAYDKARDKARALADDYPEYVDRARETGKRYADKSVETVKTTVQEQPVATLLGGIAAGFLLGWLINSRRD